MIPLEHPLWPFPRHHPERQRPERQEGEEYLLIGWRNWVLTSSNATFTREDRKHCVRGWVVNHTRIGIWETWWQLIVERKGTVRWLLILFSLFVSSCKGSIYECNMLSFVGQYFLHNYIFVETWRALLEIRQGSFYRAYYRWLVRSSLAKWITQIAWNINRLIYYQPLYSH